MPRTVPLRSRLAPEKASRLPGAQSSSEGISADTSELALAWCSAAGQRDFTEAPAAADALAVALRQGRHDAAEVACQQGAVEAAISLLSRQRGQQLDDCLLIHKTTEVLWLLVDDFESCQRLQVTGGHSALLALAREHGAKDVTVLVSIFRLLAETLYSEGRAAALWQSVDPNFIAEALEWALREDAAVSLASRDEDGRGVSPLGFICDVAALWLQRAGPSCNEAAKTLVSVIPQLLARMYADSGDVLLLQHGCRLLWALSRRCETWPEDVRQPALAALMQLSIPLRFTENAEARAYNTMALQTVAAQPLQPESSSLNQMD